MIISYKKIELEIYIRDEKIDFNLNKDIDIEEIKKSFNNTISKLSLKHNFLEYWLLRLSERNILVSNLFLDICRIKFIKTLIKKDKNIVIYTNNIAIYKYFEEVSKISFKDKFFFNLYSFFHAIRPYFQTLKFIINNLKFILKFKNKKFIKPIKDMMIIQTWVSDSNFHDNKFKDSYYNDLSSYLNENDKKVLTWPVFYNVKNEAKAVAYIRTHQDKFILIEDYLKINDYIYAIKHFIKKRFLNLGKVYIDDNDFTRVFKYYQKKETTEYVSLFYSFTSRLKKTGSENITFIVNHENMIFEKVLIMGVKNYLKDSKVLGCFHTTKPSNQLCLEYASYDEFKIAPKPDVIIFNSNKYRDYFKNKFPNIVTRNGVAFKQLHLKNINLEKTKKTKKILVLFSGTDSEIKLMFKLLNCLNNKYELIFRMHPMNIFKVEEYYINSNYIIENEIGLRVLFNKVDKVISTYSAVAVESALYGLKVGLIYEKQELVINPFDDTGINNYELLSNVEELEDFLLSKYEPLIVHNFFNIEKEDYKIYLNEEKYAL